MKISTTDRLNYLFKDARSTGLASVVSNMLQYVSDPRTVQCIDSDVLVECVSITHVQTSDVEIAALLQIVEQSSYLAR